MTTSDLLNEYAEIEEKIAQHEKINNDKRVTLDKSKDVLLASILTPEQKIKMDEINEEFKPKYEALASDDTLKADKESLAALKAVIEAETLVAKETQRGLKKMCVYTPAKTNTITTVNVEQLKGMALNIPKLKALYEEHDETTDPKAVIRKI